MCGDSNGKNEVVENLCAMCSVYNIVCASLYNLVQNWMGLNLGAHGI